MEKITFPSKDGLEITADLYKVENPVGMIVLCHRSHCNRAEYRETAPKFNAMGYSCMAIDQRSGMKVFGENNETKNRAKAQRLPTGYLDAKPDIEAAIDFAQKLTGGESIILLGSSYSAALSLLITSERDNLKATLVFSAGEHLRGMDLASTISHIKSPVYASSAKKEIQEVEEVLQLVDDQYVTHFKPDDEGFHGSKILWESVPGFEKHWEQIDNFLSRLS